MEPLALRISKLSPESQVLLTGKIVSSRDLEGHFSAKDVSETLLGLRIPFTGDIHARLRSLGRNLLIVKLSRGKWSLTPQGEFELEREIGDLSEEELLIAGGVQSGAFLFGQQYLTLPPDLAPPQLYHPVKKFLRDFPFETNVFLMTRFPDTGVGEPLAGAIDLLRSIFRQYGLSLHLASDRQIVDDLWGNVSAHMWASKYGIGIMETNGGKLDRFNANVLIEMGSMLAMGRRTAILKDLATPPFPTDIIGQVYKRVSLVDPSTLEAAVEDWVNNDLALVKDAR